MQNIIAEASQTIIWYLPFVQYCVKITTDGASNSNGYINVYVDTGTGYTLEIPADQSWAKNSVVLDKCYDHLRGVQVQGPDNDA